MPLLYVAKQRGAHRVVCVALAAGVVILCFIHASIPEATRAGGFASEHRHLESGSKREEKPDAGLPLPPSGLSFTKDPRPKSSTVLPDALACRRAGRMRSPRGFVTPCRVAGTRW